MNPNWAEENLQTIRTLMERSALYRRALAPIMIFAGVVGVAAMVWGLDYREMTTPQFCRHWLVAAVLAVVGSFLIARKQALKEKEAFWSPPTRRVAVALLPPLLAGLLLGSFPVFIYDTPELRFYSTLVWIFCYGGALHSAGFFMPRGIRLFGWAFMACACSLFCAFLARRLEFDFNANWLMGLFFGVLHLAYGVYLYLTEKKHPVV